eukprot:354567-Chlamydomonas_euryale.AAC.9
MRMLTTCNDANGAEPPTAMYARSPSGRLASALCCCPRRAAAVQLLFCCPWHAAVAQLSCVPPFAGAPARCQTCAGLRL